MAPASKFKPAPPKTAQDFIAGADSRVEEKPESPQEAPTEKQKQAQKRQPATTSVAYPTHTDIIPPPLETAPQTEERPWEKFDVTERPTHVFNIRLNNHEKAMLQHIASLDPDISMQKVVRRILVAELRRRLNVVTST